MEQAAEIDDVRSGMEIKQERSITADLLVLTQGHLVKAGLAKLDNNVYSQGFS
ncbi:unnamed protein product [Tetraodon nigroviridis]|uniref:(spotted green pufferfish) hypothetical protein n=1 Tax=Tetraodon nigroviridis TaxID=99883 RepID=Q4S198_TETNG|nr:unnamed protein product [Tetraodon nigroviridis]